MSSPVGYVPGVAGIGYDSIPSPNTATIWPVYPMPLASSSCNVGGTGTASGATGASSVFSSRTTAYLHMNPLQIDRDVVYREVHLAGSFGTVGGTGSATAGWEVGVYKTSTSGNITTTGSFYTNVTKFAYNVAMSQNDTTAGTYRLWVGLDASGSTGSNATLTSGNFTSDFAGIREYPVYSGPLRSLSEGDYYLLHGMTLRSSGSNVFNCASQYYLSQSGTAGLGFHLGSPAIHPHYQPMGRFTSVVYATRTDASGDIAGVTGVDLLPNSFAMSQLTDFSSTSNNVMKWLIPQFNP